MQADVNAERDRFAEAAAACSTSMQA